MTKTRILIGLKWAPNKKIGTKESNRLSNEKRQQTEIGDLKGI